MKAATGGPPPNLLRQAVQEARNLINPRFPTLVLASLIFFIVFRALIVLSSLGIMIFPALKGRASRKRHYFVLRKIYSNEFRGMPYLVPNRCMVIVLGELMSNVLYLVSACVNYQFYTQSEIPKATHMPICSYLGIWLAGWGLVHACFCEVELTKKRRPFWILTPRVYNTLWISWMVLVTLMIIYFSMKSFYYFEEMKKMITVLLKMSEQAAKILDVDLNYSHIPLTQLLARRDAVFRVLDRFVNTADVVAKVWVGMYVILVLFYAVTVRYLLRILQKTLFLAKSETLAPRGQFAPAIWTELEAEFRYLSRCFFLLTLSLVGHICASLVDMWSIHRIESLTSKVLISLADQVPGILIAPTLLTQSARIFTERYAADESAFCQVLPDFANQRFPNLASQLLGWDTTEHWAERSDLEIVNFPGLCEVKPSTSFNDTLNSKVEGRDNVPVLKIDISRVTVTTQDIAEK
ncbi:hypothetical protein CROQUDRAFT_74304 [Cronartium quercuum f. sp. fusiforme G11]|uniref:Uncharacterized protein n=1 Tax=Cronartium quercuum f. sp. fusiforme G11 TaxID=708437 RepID=A0A9P6NLS3_9BASI|nr:hypothetical protein CROQUDRAFT_74304 [Cronartium quercuum f. sp. fusiforme G11]